MANTPIILSDNLLDAVLHPTHILTASVGEVEGQELFRLADNLRDITRWTAQFIPGAAGNLIFIDCGTPQPADMIVFDRGRSGVGTNSAVSYSDNGVNYTDVLLAAPRTTVGGLPSSNSYCLTPDGVMWATWPSQSHRYWRIWIPPKGDGSVLSLSGVYLGQSYRFPEYLDAPGAYDYRTNHKVLKNEVSWGGVRVKRRILNFSEIDISVRLEDEDYAAFHPHVERLMDYNQPWWFCLDDSTEQGAGMMRLYQLPGDTVYDPVVNPVHREVRLLLEEVIPTLTI